MEMPGDSGRLLIVGHGRMGKLVESLAGGEGFTMVGAIDRQLAGAPDRWPAADVAIDFSTGDAVAGNVSRLAERGIPVVIGTTGWQQHEGRVKDDAKRFGIGVVASPNFAVGVNLFLALAERAGALLADQPAFGAWIHELHHAAKRDAPSGTALALARALEAGGYRAKVDVASTRAGFIPGTHTVGFDAPAETITLTHTARDRSAFARGALVAARWIQGRKGWFTFRDVLGI